MRLRPFLAAAAIAIALPATAALSPGQKAPDFTTRGALDGNIVKLHLADELRKGPVVLYFFPAAYTGGCNQEAHDFSEAMPQFKAAGATVIGMSTDTVERLVKFSKEKCAGKFTVASAGPRVVKAYDVALDRMIPDVETKQLRAVTNRTSYVIARDGKITFVHSNLSAADHVRLTLDAVRALK
ncbi:MAG: peroxiredoxin [Sphingomonas sp.]|uniref:peroxiredoxin n=1 Tax=Sphingomonas sp. TaxID=28214 RepID=UPI001AC7B92D|nr:peroxiredoxin [Sphingomonas sp.]MBN8809241.1 peroxiredoxin [Sphingomonas sp.]